MTSLPSSRNLRAKARPMPAEPPVIRIVRSVSFIRSFRNCLDKIMVIIQSMQKKSKAPQKMISHIGQHLLPVGRVGKNASYGYGTDHCGKDDDEVTLPLCCRPSRHELHPTLRAIFDQAGDSFSDIEVGTRQLRRSSRDRTTGIGMHPMRLC